jgi:hypothetical protein
MGNVTVYAAGYVRGYGVPGGFLPHDPVAEFDRFDVKRTPKYTESEIIREFAVQYARAPEHVWDSLNGPDQLSNGAKKVLLQKLMVIANEKGNPELAGQAHQAIHKLKFWMGIPGRKS